MSIASLSSRLIWPLPALLAWTGSWLVFVALGGLDVPTAFCFVAAAAVGAAVALLGSTPWRRVFIAGGFPLSFIAAGLA
nr:class I SAM-dependent methyltransferase [Pseudomonadota bacterium]